MAIRASAPVRICDIGGWTDTWFGGPGRVFNIAVSPGAHVTIQPATTADPVVLDVADYRTRYPVVPGARRSPRHPLLEACIDRLAPPASTPVEIEVRCAVPPGCGTGTSAAVAVALLGALAALRGEEPSPQHIAAEAHRVETEMLGSESGVQDQLSSALGGVNYLVIDHYPEAVVQRLPDWDELGPRLVLVSVGHGHDSSALHQQVAGSAGPKRAGTFAQLRAAAEAAREAAVARDIVGLGRAMVAGTDAQRVLLPGLVGADADVVIGVARAAGALGWKVNGAGGDGGSLTLLAATPGAAAHLVRQVEAAGPGYRVLPVGISIGGLSVVAGDP